MVKEEWSWSVIAAALSVYYDLPASEVPYTGEEKFNSWVLHLSNSTGMNLAPYHEAWGFPLDQSAFDSLDHLPVWVDDPLRGDYFEYHYPEGPPLPAYPGPTRQTSQETYDNGTNIMTVFMGSQMAVRSHRHGPIASSTEVRMSVTTTSR